MADDPKVWECKIQAEIPALNPLTKIKLLVVDEESITVDDESLRLADIDAVGYSFVSMKGMRGFGKTNFVVSAGDTTINVHHKLPGSRAGYQLFELLVRLSARTIEPRLAAAACETIRAGGTLEVGSVSVSRAGVRGRANALRKSFTLPWPEVSGVHVDDTGVFVDHIKKGESKSAISLLRLKPNAPIVPWVVSALAPEFAAGA